MLQLDRLYNLLYDDYLVVYVLDNLKTIKVNKDEMNEIARAMESIYGQVQSGNNKVIQDLKINEPVLLDSYNLDDNLRTFILLVKTDTGKLVAIATNIMLIKEKLIMMSYYRFYEGELSVQNTRIKNNDIVLKLYRANL